MRIVLPLIHLDNLVFTPLPQLRLKSALVQGDVCKPDEVTILEYSREESLQTMLDEIMALKPQIVGFSCYTWSFLAVERLSAALKMLRPEILVVWGGPHVSELPRQFFERFPKSVDLIVTWYGEGTFVALAKLWERGATADQIASILQGSWSAQFGEQAENYTPLEALGFPYASEYLPETVKDAIGDRVFLLETYRNCPFSCSYCLWGQAAKHLDAIPEEQMLRDIYESVELGARIFMFADAGLGIVRNPDRSSRDKKVFRRLAEDKILQQKGVQMRAYHFWQSMDEEMLDIFQELIGQRVMGQIDIGIQTFNKDILKDLQRPTNYERFFNVIDMLHRREIKFSLDLVLGLPGDTLEGFKDSLRKVIACKPDRTQTFPLSVLPGTAYDIRREEFGIKTIRGSYRDDAETVVATKSFPYEDMLTALDLEAWMFLYYGERLFAQSLTALAEERGVDPLDQLDDLRVWAGKKAPFLRELVGIYRKKLYDSRSDGRHMLEARLMEVFWEIEDELHQYFVVAQACSWHVIRVLDFDLLTFPKTREAASRLNRSPYFHYENGVIEYLPTKARFIWKRDPVIGAIVRNKNFYNWERVNADEHHLSDDGAQGKGDLMPETATAYD